MIKYTVLGLSLLLGSINTMADELPPHIGPSLNKISYQVSVEKWATTNTARVTVNLDAALDKIGLSNINTHVLENLRQMAGEADWHVTQFNRTQDKSGLEVLHVEAEARLPQNKLASLRDQAKKISTAGETYTLGDIDFTPTQEEVEKTHAEARAAIYETVKQEIGRLNQLYPEQRYFLNQLDFGAVGIAGSQPMFKGARAEMMVAYNNAAPAAAGATNAVIPINAKIVETAQVVIASKAPKNKKAPEADTGTKKEKE